MLDAFSLKIVGWSIDSSADTRLVLYALDMAIRTPDPAPGGIVHADHGTHFTSWAFGNRIRTDGLMPSFGCVGDGPDNAILEHMEIWHNRARRHSSIGHLTPIDFELQPALSTNPARATQLTR